MGVEAKKLYLINELLKVSDEGVLNEIEAALSKGKLHAVKGSSFKEFAGKLNDTEIRELEQIIEQGCEQINPDDWK